MEPIRGLLKQHDWTFGPELVRGGDEALVYRQHLECTLPKLLVVCRIGSFLGLDTGDIAEVAAEVSTEAGLRLYARSFHKECPGLYDAWNWQSMPRLRIQRLRLDVICRVTGENHIVYTKRDNPLTAWFHGCVVVEGTGVQP